jgi:hypothetical protein
MHSDSHLRWPQIQDSKRLNPGVTNGLYVHAGERLGVDNTLSC